MTPILLLWQRDYFLVGQTGVVTSIVIHSPSVKSFIIRQRELLYQFQNNQLLK